MARSCFFVQNLLIILSSNVLFWGDLPPLLAQSNTSAETSENSSLISNNENTDVNNQNQEIPSIFNICAKEIQAQITPELLEIVKLRLPFDLNLLNFQIEPNDCEKYLKVSSSLVQNEPSVTLSVFNCKNQNNQGCLVGSFRADASQNNKVIPQWLQHQQQGNIINITDNIQGYLIAGLAYPIDGLTNSTNSNFSTIMWQQEGVFYTLKINHNFAYNMQEIARLTAQSLPLNQETLDNINTESIAERSRATIAPTVERLDQELELAQVKVNKLKEIKVFGSTVFSQSQIDAIMAEFVAKEINENQTISLILDEAETALTNLYLENNYINSQAEIVRTKEAKELLKEGIGVIRIIEGGISEIEIEGSGGLDNYIRSYLQSQLTVPLNSIALEDSLRVLRQNPQIESLDASIRALERTEEGQSKLIVRVVPKPRFSSSITFDNYSAPSVGSERFGVNFNYNNLLGLGDQLSTFYNMSDTGGSKNFEVNYRLPVTPDGGTFLFRINPSWSAITQAPFDVLDISGNKETYELSYQHPLVKTSTEELSLALGFTYENGQTFVFDQPSPFGIGPDEKGISSTSVLHFSQNYINRSAQGAWILQSRFNLGLDFLDATINNEANVPDGEFFSWLGQVKRLQPLGEDHLLIMQSDLQLTPHGLLPAQQYTIGGATSVRGYRNSLRSGDNGFRFSIEDQITLLRNENQQSTLIFAPFFDLGTIWNNPNNPNELLPEKLLIGLGFGVEWKPLTNLSLRFDYGYPLIDIKDRGNNIQDDGIYFQLFYTP